MGCLMTGKAFIQHVLGKLFEALGNQKNLLVVAAVGPQADVLEGLPAAPYNFILRETLPQLDVLSKAHGFITHGGANSMHEALGLGVPMIVVPLFGDQPINADTIVRTGAGFGFRRPFESLTTQALKDAAMALVNPEVSNTYRAAANAQMQLMKQAGGAKAAANEIVEIMAAKSAAPQLGGA